MKHHNMFDHLETKDEVYKKLQDDFHAESLKMDVAFSIAIAAVAFGIWRTEAFYVAACAAFVGMRFLIDLSNRNFALHVIDWIEASKEPRVQTRD